MLKREQSATLVSSWTFSPTFLSLAALFDSSTVWLASSQVTTAVDLGGRSGVRSGRSEGWRMR